MASGRGEAMGWLRAGVGVALLAAPELPLRLSRGEVPTGSSVLLMRTIGIRDLVLGLGLVAAARTGSRGEARRWVWATLASDALDTALSAASAGSIGRRDALGAALLAGAFAGADLRSLGQLSRS